MKTFVCFLFLSFSLARIAFAQAPDDIIKYSYFPQHGTARSIAIGGAMGSLGGDLTAAYVNPAGLGLYRTSEIVVSPGFQFNKNKANYNGFTTSSSKSAFDLGLTGAVFGLQSRYSRNRSEAFAVAVNQTANFNNTLTYSGQNAYSSYSEQFAEEIVKNGYSPDDLLNTNSVAPFGSSLAYQTHLIEIPYDSATGQYSVYGTPEVILGNGGTLNQTKTIRTTGGIYEVALSYAANTNDKFYYGITLGIPIVSYTRNSYIREEDASTSANNDFSYSEWNDKLKTNGYGINVKLGLMFKPTDYFRLGLAIHSPTYYKLTDEESANMTTAFTNGEVFNDNSATFTDGGIGSSGYLMHSPWKFIASGSYVFREASDVQQQRGFITADVEYVTYPASSYHSDGEMTYDGEDTYYTALNSVIKDYYKGAFNFRVGGELKFNTLAVRLGGAFYGNPYNDDALKSNITQLSGGLGYRNKGIFVDLTYAYIINKDVNFPYRLQDKDNVLATYKNNRGSAMLTVGFKL